MNGSIITSVIVEGGVFGGTNTIVSTHVDVPNSGNVTVNGGMLAPGGDNLYGNMAIAKDLTFNSGGFLDAEIDSVGNTDSIAVGGNVQLGGSLDIQAVVGNFIAGQEIALINADGTISGTFANTTIPLLPNGGPLFKIDNSNPHVFKVVVLEDLIFNPSTTGQTINSGTGKAVSSYIQSQKIDPNSDFGFVVNSLGLVPSDQIDKVLALLSPDFFGNIPTISLESSSQIMGMNGYTSLFKPK